MKLLRLLVVFGLALLSTEARFIDRSVLSEGDVVPRSIVSSANEITDVKLLPEIDTTTENNIDAEIPLQQPKDISTTKNTDSDGNQVVEAKVEEKVSPVIETDESNKLEKTFDGVGIADDDDDKVKDTILSNNQLTAVNDIENASSFEEKLIEVSTTQIPPIKLEDATPIPVSTLTVSTTIAPVDFYKPLKPFFFPPPLPPTMLLSKPLPPVSPPSTHPFNELATSESVVGLGLVLLPNPFYYKKSTEEHVHGSYPTVPTATKKEPGQTNADIGNGINDINNKKVQYNPIYFYLDSKHVQHTLSQFAGDANKESTWVPPFMLYANKNISPQEDTKFTNKPDSSPVKEIETQPAAISAEPILAPLNEQSVLFAVEIPQPIYKMFKSLISLFSL